jgi:hypothetical protein
MSGQHLFSYSVLEWMIVIEIISVIVIVVFSYAIYAFYKLKERYYKKRREVIFEKINQAKSQKEKISVDTFPNNYYKLSDFALVISKFWNEKTEENLTVALEGIFQQKLLPLARKKRKDRSWINRFFAAQIFYYLPTEEDTKFIVKLVGDEVTLISIFAIKAAIKLGAYDAIHCVIKAIATRRKLSESIFIHCFKQANPKTREHVIKVLNTSEDPHTKACCYRVLSMYPDKTSEAPKKDVLSDHKELRLEAIRALQYEKEGGDNKTLLLKLLSSKDWESRSQAIKMLGKLGAVDAISDIEPMLKDDVWWVRYHAAKTLKQFGEKGAAILKKQRPKEDQFAYDVSQFVLGNKSQQEKG